MMGKADSNQTGTGQGLLFEKGAACEVFPYCPGNLNHEFLNTIGINLCHTVLFQLFCCRVGLAVGWDGLGWDGLGWVFGTAERLSLSVLLPDTLSRTGRTRTKSFASLPSSQFGLVCLRFEFLLEHPAQIR